MDVKNAAAAPMQAAQSANRTAPENSLGQDAFLKILVTQMKNQNPMEPMKDTEFIGQMAQFSSLEQLIKLNETMSQFAANNSKPNQEK